MLVSTTVPPNGSELVVHLTGADSTSFFDWLVAIGPAAVAVVAIIVGYLQVRRTLEATANVDTWKWKIQQRRELYARFLNEAHGFIRSVSSYLRRATNGVEFEDDAERFVEMFESFTTMSVLLDEVRLVGSDKFISACDVFDYARRKSLAAAKTKSTRQEDVPALVSALWEGHTQVVAAGRADLVLLQPDAPLVRPFQ